MTMKTRLVVISAGALLLVLGANFAAGQSGYDLYQQALEKERVEGRLQEAIQLYQRIAKDFAKDRALAAKALLQLGICYEKQGNAEARKTFERIVKEYAEQSDAVALAGARLIALAIDAELAQSDKGLTLTKLKFDKRGEPSPDGRYMAFFDDDWDLSVHDLMLGNSRKVLPTELRDREGNSLWSGPVWSRDGKKLASAWTDGETTRLKVVNMDGSGLRTILSKKTDDFFDIYGWFPDGSSVFCVLRDETSRSWNLLRVNAENGSIIAVQSNFNTMGHISPDGRYTAFVQGDGVNGLRTMKVVPLSGGTGVDIVRSNYLMPAGWDASGMGIIFASDRAGSIDLWRLAVKDGRPEGEIELIKKNIGAILPIGVTQRGFFYKGSPSASGYDLSIGTMDPATGALTITEKVINKSHIGASYAPAWSPDGRQLAYLAATKSSDRGSCSTLCILSQETGSEREIVLPMSIITSRLTWSSDGRFLFGLNRDNKNNRLIRIDSHTGETQIAATVAILDASIIAWTADGNVLEMTRRTPKETILFVRDLVSGEETELYRAETEAFSLMYPSSYPISPDGKWIAFVEREKKIGSMQRLMVILRRGGTARALHTSQRVAPCFWTMDSKHILCSSFDEKGAIDSLTEISIEGGATRKLETAKQFLFTNTAFHPDGIHLALLTPGPSDNGTWLIENLPPIRLQNR